MATSAFKSTSKRGTSTSTSTSSTIATNDSNTSRILRRSRSVSAISRTKHSPQIDVPSEFSKKCDNPLFSTAEDVVIKGTVSKALGTSSGGSSTSGAGNGDDGRGRSVTRNSVAKAGIGRSVSRVRGRSVSRGHYESEKEERFISTNSQNRGKSKQVANSGRMASVTRNASEVRGRAKSSQTAAREGQVTEYSEDDSACSLQIANWEDGISIGSMSEAEEKTTVHERIKQPVHGDHLGSDAAAGGIYETVRSEVRRAISDIQNDLANVIRRNNVSIATTNVTDISPDLVNPGAVELVLDIRKEYSKKLEESEERARKLREDLAVEEHRGQELSRILKDIVPEPKPPTPQRSRIRRRTSSERKNMSKRLTEEAMAFFDECVSISTFDSSDFSAPEDPAYSSVGTTKSVGGSGFFGQASQSMLSSYGQEKNLSPRQALRGYDELTDGHKDSRLTVNSRSDELLLDQLDQSGQSHQFLFSAAETPKELIGAHNDIMSYVKHFKRDADIDLNDAEINRRSGYDADEYKLQGCLESFLFDKVFLKNSIESGSLHLCGGGHPFSFSPFGPAF